MKKEIYVSLNTLRALISYDCPNNIGDVYKRQVQYPQNKLEDISSKQLEDTFRTNIFSMFYLTKAALKYLKRGAKIINTASVTAYNGHKLLIDYSATKGAIVTFTRSLALSLISRAVSYTHL